MTAEIAPSEDRGRKTPDRRSILRLCGWGSGAAIALAAVVIATYSNIGGTRLQLALTNATERGQPVAVAPMPVRVADNSIEIKQLAETVRALTADRDRLKNRIAGLEHTLNDVTGAIKSEATATVSAQAAKDTPKETSADRVAAAPAVSAPPVISAPVTAPVAATPAAPTVEQVPLPPTRVASAPPSEPPPVPLKPEFGIDLGGAVSMDALRGQWSAVKANYGPLLLGLHPVVTMRERRPGAPEYRLVVGPLPSVNAAAKLCARFASRPGCRPAKFDGQRLAQQ
jgi:hypothetical protein